MHNTTDCLSPLLMQQLASEDLSPSEMQQIESHLTQCDHCRELLEAVAKDPIWTENIYPNVQVQGSPEEDAFGDGVDPAPSSPYLDDILDVLGPSDDPHMIGRIGSYEVVGVVGRGGMGVVFKAFESTLNRFVAIKMLLPHLASSPAARKRFAREGRAAAAVVDDNVLPIYSVAEWKGIPYLVTQYSRGASLQKRLDQSGPLDVKEILRIAIQTARGLAAAHAQGLVHRDVKPANILLDDGVERVLLTDFGLARAADDTTLTRTGYLAGTPQYMSPEQAEAKALDARADLFSLGSTMYAMCTGHAPFRAESSHAVLRLICDKSAVPIRELNNDIPEWLCQLIHRLMAKDPEDRFASANEVAETLEACLTHLQQPAIASLPPIIAQNPKVPAQVRSGSNRFFSHRMYWLGGALMGSFAFLFSLLLWSTSAPDISGIWTGDGWGQVELVQNAPATYRGSYSDTVTGSEGRIELRWSRIENRYNGTWREGDDRLGELSLRVVGDEIRGAFTTDIKSNVNPATPRLADLSWSRLPQPNTIGQDAALGDKSTGSLQPQGESENVNLLDQIQGRWVVSRYMEEGADDLSTYHNRELNIAVEENLLVIRGRYTDNPTEFEVPWELHLKGTGFRQDIDILFDPSDTERPCWILGIIELKDGRLRICGREDCGASEKKRPQHYASGKDTWLLEAHRPTEHSGGDSSPRTSGPIRDENTRKAIDTQSSPILRNLPHLNQLFQNPANAPVDSTTWLSDAVAEFNAKQRQNRIGSSQPLLTDDEVIAAVRWATVSFGDQSVPDAELKKLVAAIELSLLPDSWTLVHGLRWKNLEGDLIEKWSVNLIHEQQDGNHWMIPVRSRHIRVVRDFPEDFLDEEYDASETPLSEALRELAPQPNPHVEIQGFGQTIAPVTEQEIVASVTEYLFQNSSSLDKATIRRLSRVRDRKVLRPDERLEVISRFESLGGSYHGYDFNRWSLRLLYPRTKDGQRLVTAVELGFVFTDSSPVDRVKDEGISWGPVADDGLQCGVVVELQDAEDLSGKAYKPTFYFRNPTGKSTNIALEHIVDYGLEVRTSTGERLPIRQSMDVVRMDIPLIPSELSGELRINKPGVPFRLGTFDDKEFAELVTSDAVYGLSGDAPLHIANLKGHRDVRLRFQIRHPAKQEHENMTSGEVRLSVSEDLIKTSNRDPYDGAGANFGAANSGGEVEKNQLVEQLQGRWNVVLWSQDNQSALAETPDAAYAFQFEGNRMYQLAKSLSEKGV